ncbi:MAG: ComF family protein [Bacteroidetes bacterium]|nr:ComF family protein [Bacteroidota bacterium]
MTLINDFMSLIYPRHCEACVNGLFKHETYICNHCKLTLPKSNYHKNGQNELNQTFAGRVPLNYGLCFYLFEKSGKVQKLLHAIKYEDQKELAQFIGELYAQELAKEGTLAEVDVIVPIPLHKKKLKLRGYNQSEWFAKGLAKALEKPLDIDSFERAHETSTQTKKKKYQRWENVEGIFTIKDHNALINKHILLVDDVITTGATIEAAWMALKNVEGIKLSVASIAFAARKL